MELSILDSSFHRKTVFEDYNSLIWSERYFTYGDFKLVSPNISKVLTQLPVGGPFDPPTLINVKGSTVPMVVESHKIENPRRGEPIITTTGRSFETILDRRITVRDHTITTARQPWVVEAASPSDAAYDVMHRIVELGEASGRDIIPEIVILDAVNSVWPQGTAKYPVEPKELYEWVMETIKLGNHGLKATMPNTNGNQIAISIYEGVDKRQSVVFQSTLEEFDNTSHLISNLGYKNAMTTEAKNSMTYDVVGVPATGLARRVAYQNKVSDITLESGTELTNLIKNVSKVALADLTPVVLFSGEVASLQDRKYGIDYNLGDMVKLSGEYGLTQDVRVVEFIRTEESSSGESSYPTFEAL